jgi:hypothetical protein
MTAKKSCRLERRIHIRGALLGTCIFLRRRLRATLWLFKPPIAFGRSKNLGLFISMWSKQIGVGLMVRIAPNWGVTANGRHHNQEVEECFRSPERSSVLAMTRLTTYMWLRGGDGVNRNRRLVGSLPGLRRFIRSLWRSFDELFRGS